MRKVVTIIFLFLVVLVFVMIALPKISSKEPYTYEEAVKKFAKGNFVTVDNKKVHYIEKGRGRPIILIHGFLYSAVMWNQNIDVQGKVEIFKDNNLISNFNTIPVNIKEKSSSIMEAYWNTQDIEIREYDISVKAEYDGKTSEKSFISVVSIDDIQIKD